MPQVLCGGTLVGQRLGSNRSYYLFDGLGSVVALTDSAGNVTNRYAYDPYGGSTRLSGTVANPWRFGGSYGAYTDVSTGLLKIGQRFYDPGLGRWTQQDPLDRCSSAPQSSNRYVYASDDPINRIDPSGLLDTGCFISCLNKAYAVLPWYLQVTCGALLGACFSGAAPACIVLSGCIGGYALACARFCEADPPCYSCFGG